MVNHILASSYRTSAPRGIRNLAWGILATLLSVFWTAISALLAALFAALRMPHAVTLVSRGWGGGIIRVCGIKVHLEGLENIAGLKSYILVANHQSFFDIFALAAYLPGEPRFVAKKELLRIPVIGYALQHSGHVIIDRESGGKAIRKAIESIRAGFNICVFAEGRRFNDNRIHEFNDGGAWLAILTKLPAVPMAISGSGALFPRGAKVVRPGGQMRMTIGRPIATTGMKSGDRTELTRKLEEAVRATFAKVV